MHMIDILDPNRLEDTAAASLMKDLGEKAALEGRLAEMESELARLPEGTDDVHRGELLLEIAHARALLERGGEAWPQAFTALGIFLAARDWQHAAEACEVLYRCEQPQSLSALGQGIWLAVTFPLDPETTVNLLSHLVDDTPDDADGAAVAAAAAAFLVDLRAEPGPDRDRLAFFAQQLMGRVARRHSQVEDQAQFDYWVEKLELNDPDKFFVRLRNVVDVLVQEEWWFDRDALRASIPED